MDQQSDLPNYYDLLGVRHNASIEAIQSAWRLSALENHPDLAAKRGSNYIESEHRMILINQAYQTLLDPQKRREYDLTAGTIEATCIRCGTKGSLRKSQDSIAALCDTCWTPGVTVHAL